MSSVCHDFVLVRCPICCAVEKIAFTNHYVSSKEIISCKVISMRYAGVIFSVLQPPTHVALQPFLPCPYRFKVINTLV
ncbi:hypothetical protein E2C01_086052 [Portunus trituberculatus]|uniref:Uncharacterized protein n=1 Tax=Portunus trituberculatus TaxID=210409 RepID=A0A5B7IZR4_PORTR|nr:hypothetical protein [Portunus trituberculatus]